MTGFTLMADWIATWQEFGIFQFYLPWLLTFVIFWALLSKVKLFGDSNKEDREGRMARAVNLVIALGASMYIMVNTQIGIDFAMFLSTLFGGAFLTILTVIAFTSVLYVAYHIARGEDPMEGDHLSWNILATLALFAAIVLAIGTYIASSGAAFFPGFVIPGMEVPSMPTVVFPSINLTSQELAMFVLLAITGIAIWYVTRSGSPTATEQS